MSIERLHSPEGGTELTGTLEERAVASDGSGGSRITTIPRPTKPPKGDKAYRALWGAVDTAIRALFRDHPEYFTDAGREAGAMSLNKRVLGAVMHHLGQERMKALGLRDASDTAIALALAALEVLASEADGTRTEVGPLAERLHAFLARPAPPVIVEVKRRPGLRSLAAEDHR